jgi:hypothetical protein
MTMADRNDDDVSALAKIRIENACDWLRRFNSHELSLIWRQLHQERGVAAPSDGSAMERREREIKAGTHVPFRSLNNNF